MKYITKKINARKLYSECGSNPDPSGGAYSIPQTHSWWEVGSRRGTEPHPPTSGLELQPLA